MRLLPLIAASFLLLSAGLPYATFEKGVKSIGFNPGTEALAVDVIDNFRKDAVNPTGRCLQVVTVESGNFIWGPYGRTMDFTLDPPVFTMKVMAPAAGMKVTFKLEPSNLKGPVKPVWLVCTSTKAGEWEDMTFDFSAMNLPSNKYRKINIGFQKSEDCAPDWYIDEIYGPDDDLSSISLFKRWEGNPVFGAEGKREDGWRTVSIANAGVLAPEESPDGRWRLYVRGSGKYSQSIGLFWQEAGSFRPFGPWTEYPDNPVVMRGEKGEWDDQRVLDTAPVVGPGGEVYVFYKGFNTNGDSRMGVAWSTDGGYRFNKTGRPWRKDAAGSTSVVYHEGRYYVFYGTKVYVTDNPLDGDKAEAFPTISLGGAPSNFDDKSLWGNMVWRIKGVDKWFMTYQGSASHGDFPDRFHVAVSDDLLHWTKVDNPRPFFTRGAAGQWDQGAIWCPEVFEHEGMLYLYYEGWGTPGDVYDRNKVYFRPARSRLGGASCSVGDFLEWCGLSKDEL